MSSHYRSIPFMRYRLHAAVISAALVIIAIGSLLFRGVNYGLDFTGGTQLELHFSAPPALDEIREVLTANDYPNHEVVNVGTDQDVVIRVQDNKDAPVPGADNEQASTKTADTILGVLDQAMELEITMKSSSFVSSQVGEEMLELGFLGGLLSLFMIMIYVAMRFQYKFSVGAVVSLLHDTLLVLGFFSLTRMNFDLTVLAAVLAVIGYSLNDTIVVADRVRENFRLLRGVDPAEVIDISITQTMGRSIVTSLTVVLVMIALLLVGGEVVRGFAVALLVGVFFGTSSSIYIACAILMYMNVSKQDLMPPIKKDEELDAMP
jgi:preprotein translocase subunit SecF